MFRFTIRDVLWLTTLVALSVAWNGKDALRELKSASVLRRINSRSRTSSKAKPKHHQ